MGNRFLEMLIQSSLCCVRLVALLTLVRCYARMLVHVVLKFWLQTKCCIAIVTLVSIMVRIVHIIDVILLNTEQYITSPARQFDQAQRTLPCYSAVIAHGMLD